MVKKAKEIFSPEKAMSRALMRAANLYNDQDAREAAKRLDAMPLPDPRSNKPIAKEILDPPHAKPSPTRAKPK